MTAASIDRDTALRVALAARTLPGVDVGTLLEILDDRLGRPLTLESLARITVTDLKTGLGSLDGEEDGEDIGIGLEPMKLAVRILWGETSEDPNLPDIQEYKQGDMSDSIRVGISSNSSALLDGHFGSCLRYLIYQISKDEIRLVDIRSALEADFADDKNLFRANLINDCQVVYCVSIGGPAAAKVVRAGAYPLKKIEGGKAEYILQQFQTVMAGSPPPWLAKILGVSEKERLKNYQGEESEELVETD